MPETCNDCGDVLFQIYGSIYFCPTCGTGQVVDSQLDLQAALDAVYQERANNGGKMLNMKIYWFIAPPEEGCPIYSAVEKNLFTAEQVSRFLKISKRAARRKIKKLLAEERITWHYIKSDYWSLANQLERASNGGKS